MVKGSDTILVLAMLSPDWPLAALRDLVSSPKVFQIGLRQELHQGLCSNRHNLFPRILVSVNTFILPKNMLFSKERRKKKRKKETVCNLS